eukprot:15325097-Ditylum_brightwellii.AAC.1
MQRTLLPITEECCILGNNAHSAETNIQASLPTQDVPPIQGLNGEEGSVATTLTDKVTLSTIRTIVTEQVVGDGSSILLSSAALATEESEAESVMSSGSSFSMASSSIFLLTPILPKIRKITNINKALYEEGYHRDGDIGPFHDSVEHEDDLSPNIEEEALPIKRRV